MPYDPLMTQFLTQGQMGHMPEAQFMTPHDYGAYRTLPGMQQMGAMPQQQMSMWQAYLIQNQGRIPFMGDDSPPYVFDVYNPAASQPWYQTMAQRRWQDAQTSIGAGVTDIGAATGVALGVGGLPGLAAGALAPSVTAPAMDRVRGMRDIQASTIPRIMGGPDVSGFGYGFSAPAAQRLDESVRRMGAGDMIFRQEDYRELLDEGVDRSLFDFDISEQQYTQTLRTLRDNVEVMQKLLGSTDFKELTRNMKRLLDMGMDPEFMGAATRLQAGYGFTAGRGIEEMTQAFGQPGAMAFTRAGLTPYQGSFQAMSAAASVEMSRRLGIVSPEEVARQGGVSGMAQAETQNIAQFLGADGGFADMMVAGAIGPDGEMDTDFIRGIASGEISYDQVFSRAQQTMAERPEDFLTHRDQYRHEMIDELGPEGAETAIFQIAQQVGSEAHPDANFRTQTTAGLMQLGFDRETAAQISQRWSSVEYQELRREQLETQRRHMIEEGRARELYEDSPVRSAMISLREGLHRVGEETYGRWMGRRARRTEAEERAAMGHIGPEADHMDLLIDRADALFESGRGIDEDTRRSYEEFIGTADDSILRLATAEERHRLEAYDDPTVTQTGWGLRQLQLAERAFIDGSDGQELRDRLGIEDADRALEARLSQYDITDSDGLLRRRGLAGALGSEFVQELSEIDTAEELSDYVDEPVEQIRERGLSKRDDIISYLTRQEDIDRDEAKHIWRDLATEEGMHLIRDEDFMRSIHGVLGQDDAYVARYQEEYRDRWDTAYGMGDLQEFQEETRSMLRDVFGEGRTDEIIRIMEDPDQARSMEAAVTLGALAEGGQQVLDSERAREHLTERLREMGIEEPGEIVEHLHRHAGFVDDELEERFMDALDLEPEQIEQFRDLGRTLESDERLRDRISPWFGGALGFIGDDSRGTGLGGFFELMEETGERNIIQAMGTQRQRIEETMGTGVEDLITMDAEEVAERLDSAEGDERTVLQALHRLHEDDDWDVGEMELLFAVGDQGELGDRREEATTLVGEEEALENIDQGISDINSIIRTINDTHDSLDDTIDSLTTEIKKLNTFLRENNG